MSWADIARSIASCAQYGQDAEAACDRLVAQIDRAVVPFAARAGGWQNDYMVDFKMAWNRYFGAKKA